MGSYYDTMQVCKKGHQITAMLGSYPQHGQKFCATCGTETMHMCTSCKANIRGYYHVDGVIGGKKPSVPLNCHGCGKAYPWKASMFLSDFGKGVLSVFKYILDSIVGFFVKK